MAEFRKYEFPSYEIYVELKERHKESAEFIELGILRNDKFSVDALWLTPASDEFLEYEIWDVTENGSHTFIGFSFNE